MVAGIRCSIPPPTSHPRLRNVNNKLLLVQSIPSFATPFKGRRDDCLSARIRVNTVDNETNGLIGVVDHQIVKIVLARYCDLR
jgi:hypothetical protein